MNDTLQPLFLRMEELLKSFVQNPAQDYASYRERVGEYKGLQEAINYILSTEEDEN